MKKHSILLVLLAFTALLFACKKDYNCRCGTKYIDSIILPHGGYAIVKVVRDSIISLPKSTKKKAERSCDDIEKVLLNEIANKQQNSGDCYVY
ncbi:MAG: hypothetical protein R2800_08655 [Flavipsychrobacter sp.]